LRVLYRRLLTGGGGSSSEAVFAFLSASVWLVAALCGGSCQAADERAGSFGWAKVELDLSWLDDAGLYGPPDGLRALDYELCIPAGPRFREEVALIDPRARFHETSPGRVGCRSNQVLVIGNTHQPDFRGVLAGLAALPYVERIVPAWFE
jgi:hypothetical protein